MTNFCIVPLSVMGKLSVNLKYRGTLKAAIRPLQYAIISFFRGCFAGFELEKNNFHFNQSLTPDPYGTGP
jgi:hypothetical protein